MPHIFIRSMPPLHFLPAPPESGRCEAVVSVLREGAYIVGINFAGFSADMQTTRAGVEAMRDACNLALLVEP